MKHKRGSKKNALRAYKKMMAAGAKALADPALLPRQRKWVEEEMSMATSALKVFFQKR